MKLFNKKNLSSLNSPARLRLRANSLAGRHLSFQKGFTLIELLVVIAVIGVLAAIVLVGINPIEQLARGRDAGRKTTVGQLANALEAYFTSQGGSTAAAYYPDASTAWITRLVTAGEFKSVPSAVAYSKTDTVACVPSSPGFAQNGWCYAGNVVTNPTSVIAYVRLESSSENAKCLSTETAYFLWSSTDAKAGTVCVTGSGVDPTAMSGYSYK